MPNQTSVKIISFLITLLAGQACGAETELIAPLSLKAGLSGTMIAGDSFQPRPGYHGQISLYMPYNQSTHIVIGLEYIRANAFLKNRTVLSSEKDRLMHGNIDMSARFLELSLHLSHNFPVSDRYKLGVFFGPALSGVLDTDDSHFHLKREETIDPNNANVNYDYPQYIVDGTRGGGYSLHFGFTFAKNEYPTRYQYGLDFVVPMYPIQQLYLVHFNQRIRICNLSFEYFL